MGNVVKLDTDKAKREVFLSALKDLIKDTVTDELDANERYITDMCAHYEKKIAYYVEENKNDRRKTWGLKRAKADYKEFRKKHNVVTMKIA